MPPQHRVEGLLAESEEEDVAQRFSSSKKVLARNKKHVLEYSEQYFEISEFCHPEVDP